MRNYQTEKIVGKGSFGQALLVKRKNDGKRFIIKEIKMNNMSARAIKQNELEATLLSRLNHPNIVKFIGKSPLFTAVIPIAIILSLCNYYPYICLSLSVMNNIVP